MRLMGLLGRSMCVSLAVGAASALATCPGPHDIEDMLAAGLTARTVRALFEETGWAACLSEEDVDRLRRAGVREDLVAFLESRTATVTRGPESAAASPEPEYVEPSEPPTYQYPYPYYPYTYGYGGVFLGGGGLHHHHPPVGHHWMIQHDLSHVGAAQLAHPRLQAPATARAPVGYHGGGHSMNAGHAGHSLGGHAGHGGGH